MKLTTESIRVNDIELANEIIWVMNGTAIKQADENDDLRAKVAHLTAGSEAMQEDADRKSLIIFAKEQEIAELTRMLFALGKQDGQTIRELTEENRGLRQMLHMEPR